MSKNILQAIKIAQEELDKYPDLPNAQIAYNIVGKLVQLEDFDKLTEEDEFDAFFNDASQLETSENWSIDEKNLAWKDLLKHFEALKNKYLSNS